ANGAEVVVPEIMDFFSYCAYSGVVNRKLLKSPVLSFLKSSLTVEVIDLLRTKITRCFNKHPKFGHPHSIKDTAKAAQEISSLGSQSGEGWFLAGELVQLVRDGVPNVVLLSPWGCLPNHVTGKAMLHSIKRIYPQSNMAAIDYDAGTSEVNQVSRIKLLLSAAFRKLEAETGIRPRVVSEISKLSDAEVAALVGETDADRERERANELIADAIDAAPEADVDTPAIPIKEEEAHVAIDIEDLVAPASVNPVKGYTHTSIDVARAIAPLAQED
ncbi:hypothetical protein KIPB_013730, partial [Kipferlia bialata]